MRSKVALGLGLLLLLGCRTKNMAMTPMQLNECAIGHTAAWCSHEPQRVPDFFAEHSSLTINRGVPAVGRAAIATAAQGFMTAFPDLVVMDSLETAGPTVRYHWTLTGTNTGPGGTSRPVHISGYESGPSAPMAGSPSRVGILMRQRIELSCRGPLSRPPRPCRITPRMQAERLVWREVPRGRHPPGTRCGT